MSISNFDFILNGKILIPLMQGGMGVNISTAELALSVASNNGVGHISDAMILSVSDDVFKTSYTKKKYFAFRRHHESIIKSDISFDLNHIYSATRSYVENTINQKKDGLIFVNCMEKLTMGAPKETLKSRLNAALDGGIDGISLSAGLHLNSLFLIKDNPRFNDVSIGIIVSSKRALEVFIKKIWL
ncbi:MAG: hypothetical protein U1D25_04460 [Hydrogenophaga sp.]|uniref:hypothetical protein n=1 Tax=Hydrogenophaga sp. TaxID=1904254 RepID=UPI002AB8C62A|nr:hypothetical protein [Hydrogenophaga sp.]MDZ4187353.1 hypothetical protein [Hydrogenophaga sp.]